MKLESIIIAVATILFAAVPISVMLYSGIQKYSDHTQLSSLIPINIIQKQKVLPPNYHTTTASVVFKGASDLPLPPIYTINGGCQQYLPLVQKYNWDVNTAMAIMEAESTSQGIPCDSNAKDFDSNGTVDRGLFQVNSIHADLATDMNTLFDPQTNVRIAYEIYSGQQGWGAWSTYNSGAYLRYLK